MSRLAIFICTIAGAVVCATLLINPNAGPISFGMVAGAGSALFMQWVFNGFEG